MSNPIGPQPGGYPFNPNTPGSSYGSVPPQKSGVNGWKIAGFGCLGLFLLAAVGAVLLGVAARNQYQHPSKNSPLGIGIIAGKASVDGARLHSAIVAYHEEKGKYPTTLEQLVSENRIDGKMLHNDLDDYSSPGHVSWRYIKPAEGAPGNTPVLEEPYKITMGGSTQSSRIVITLDGRSQAGISAPPPAPEGQTP